MTSPDLRSTGFDRREMMRLLGTAAGAGVVAGMGPTDLVASTQPTPAQPPAFPIPRGAIIRTNLRDLDPHAIDGFIMMHEHLLSERYTLEWMTEEMRAARRHGIACMVSVGGSRDRVPLMKELARRSGVHIIQGGGYFLEQNYPPDVKTKSEDEIADDLVRNAAELGSGAFGEIGPTDGKSDITALEKKVWRALGKAHLRTGLPIITHMNYGTAPDVPRDMALRVLDVFESVGVKPQSVALGHMCCLDDPKAEIAQQGARRGAFIAFDRLTRHHQWVTDEQRVVMVQALLDAGYVNQLVFADDWSGQPSTGRGEAAHFPGSGLVSAHDGGPGWARTAVWFLPLLRKAGIKEGTLHQILVDNPRRLLAFVPKKA